MRARASLLTIVSLFMSVFATAPATATPATGVGAISDSPLVMASYVGTSNGGYLVVAFRSSDNQSTRVIVTPRDGPIGLLPIDDVVLDASALTYEYLEEYGSWNVYLEAPLPTMGHVSIAYSSPMAMVSLKTGGCFYDFVSPTFGLTGSWGAISGSVGGYQITAWACNSWGVDASGVFRMPPLSDGLSST